VEGAVRHCKEQGGGRTRCKVYAVGDTIVEGHSQAELADAIEAYQLEVSGSKSTPSLKTVYCKRSNGTVVYSSRPCGGTQEITKAEYDRLKDKKTDTASTTSKSKTEPSVDDPLEAKLEKLKKLLEMGLITEEEAAAKRVKLLDDL